MGRLPKDSWQCTSSMARRRPRPNREQPQAQGGNPQGSRWCIERWRDAGGARSPWKVSRSRPSALTSSGCSTYLKTIAGEMNGIYLDENTKINYRGLTSEQMQGQFRGEAVYTADVDVHFPKLTVGQTLQ